MKVKQINVNGATIPALGFGTFQLENDTAETMVKAALDAGYRHIDTAQIYKNEEGVGRAIAASDVPREEIFLTTKVWFDKLDKAQFMPSVEESLKKLQTDYVDLLLIHWPNPDVPVEEYIGELMKAQEKGYTKHIGVSNHTTALLDKVLATGAKIITNQVEYHPFINQDTLNDYLSKNDITLTAYSPIAQGKVMGNDTLKTIGEKYGKNEAQVTLRWMIQQDGVMAIPRSSKEAHMKANLNIFDFELTSEEMQEITALKQDDGRIVSPPFAPDWD